VQTNWVLGYGNYFANEAMDFYFCTSYWSKPTPTQTHTKACTRSPSRNKPYIYTPTLNALIWFQPKARQDTCQTVHCEHRIQNWPSNRGKLMHINGRFCLRAHARACKWGCRCACITIKHQIWIESLDDPLTQASQSVSVHSWQQAYQGPRNL